MNISLRENQTGWQDRVKRLETSLSEIKREKDKVRVLPGRRRWGAASSQRGNWKADGE